MKRFRIIGPEEGEQSIKQPPFHIVANQLALDLANTQVMDGGARVDLIADFESLVDWLTTARVLSPQQKSTVLTTFVTANARGQAVREAKRLRWAMDVLIEAAVSGKEVPDSVLYDINHVLRGESGYQQVIRNRNGFSVINESNFKFRLTEARRETGSSEGNESLDSTEDCPYN